jgi:hypothetical protein
VEIKNAINRQKMMESGAKIGRKKGPKNTPFSSGKIPGFRAIKMCTFLSKICPKSEKDENPKKMKNPISLYI